MRRKNGISVLVVGLTMLASLVSASQAVPDRRVYADLEDCENTFLLKLNVRATLLGEAYGNFGNLLYHGWRQADDKNCNVDISVYANGERLVDHKVLRCTDANPLGTGAY